MTVSHMTKTRQRVETTYQQGHADGYKGRPFRVFTINKQIRFRWIDQYCLRTYHTGFERGRRRRLREQWWRKWSVVVNKALWSLLGFLGGVTLLGLLLQW